jgi:hypothetical protein
MRWILALALALPACGGKFERIDDEDSAVDTDGLPATEDSAGDPWPDPTGPCENRLLWADPADAQEAVWYGTPIMAEIEQFEPAILEVYQGGAFVDGVMLLQGRRLLFEPHRPLTPETTYDVILDWTCGREPWTFRTGSLGAPVSLDYPEGKGFALSFDGARVVEPPGWEATVLDNLAGRSVLVGFDAVGAAEVDLTVTWGREGDPGGKRAGPAQDPCLVAPQRAGLPWRNPRVDFSPPSALEGGVRLIADGLTAALDLTEAGGGTGELRGVVDTRNWGSAPSEVCTQLWDAYNVRCAPCADGAETCTTLRVDLLQVREVAPVAPRSAAQIAADSACQG